MNRFWRVVVPPALWTLIAPPFHDDVQFTKAEFFKTVLEPVMSTQPPVLVGSSLVDCREVVERMFSSGKYVNTPSLALDLFPKYCAPVETPLRNLMPLIVQSSPAIVRCLSPVPEQSKIVFSESPRISRNDTVTVILQFWYPLYTPGSTMMTSPSKARAIAEFRVSVFGEILIVSHLTNKSGPKCSMVKNTHKYITT